MTTETTTATAARVAELQAQLDAAHAESVRAQAMAVALPARLAAGDTTVTTADLIQAGPVVAIAKAKVTALAGQLATAQEERQLARVTELAQQLRNGEPFLSPAQVEREMERITAWVLKELTKFGKRVDAHNAAFAAVVGDLPRGTSQVVLEGTGGETVAISNERSGHVIEMDGAEWFDLPTDGWGREILDRVDTAELIARDAERTPAIFFSPYDAA